MGKADLTALLETDARARDFYLALPADVRVLAKVKSGRPALTRALELQKAAGEVGFDDLLLLAQNYGATLFSNAERPKRKSTTAAYSALSGI